MKSTALQRHARRTRLRHMCLAMAAVLVACAFCAGPAPEGAWAASGQEKHALPTLDKAVSANGSDFSQSLEADAGSRVRYRIRFTMPEDIADMHRFECTVHDKPDTAISLDARTAHARVLDSQGNVKAQVALADASEDGHLGWHLGDLKEACPDICFGDTVALDVAASLAADAAGDIPNIAWLRYDAGDGAKETEKAMALVRIPPAPQGGHGEADSLPQTGDASSQTAVLVAATALGVAAIGWRRRRAP